MNAENTPQTKRIAKRFLLAGAALMVAIFIINGIILRNSFSFRQEYLNHGKKTLATILNSKRISPWQVQVSIQFSTEKNPTFTTVLNLGCSATKNACSPASYPSGGNMQIYYIEDSQIRAVPAQHVENWQIELIWLVAEGFIFFIGIIFYRASRRV